MDAIAVASRWLERKVGDELDLLPVRGKTTFCLTDAAIALQFKCVRECKRVLTDSEPMGQIWDAQCAAGKVDSEAYLGKIKILVNQSIQKGKARNATRNRKH